jgi:uncharacterized membrane protein
VDGNITLTAASTPVTHVPVGVRPERLESIDLLRGVVMIIMALDHVRDFFSDRLHMDPVDLNTTTQGIFLTRWITHYCAPTFIFLAGTAAFLSGTRGKTRSELSWFLLTRGAWLAVMEVTINRALWMSNYDIIHHGAGVFWAIGWSMIVLSGLVYFPAWVAATFGVAMIALHNLLDGLTAQQVHLPEWIWVILHSPGDAAVVKGAVNGEDITFGTGYCLIPWMGVMAVGYGFGTIMQRCRSVRRPLLFVLGIGITLAFVVLRYANVYGDPRPWSEQSTPFWTVLSFLNCTKYPPSLLFLLMTLGPAITFLAMFDRPLGPLAGPVIVFGRVPFFFYVLHIPLIHGGAILLDYCRFGWSPLAGRGPWEVGNGPMPESYGVDLPTVYVIWIAVVLILYLPCRWFAGVKQRHRDAWLSYV